MPRNSAGSMAIDGSPFVTGTTIDSTDMNAKFDDIENELTNSLDRDGRGAMTEPLKAANGTAGTPALTFESDTDTGLYRDAANNPAISAGGVKAQEWTTTGTALPLGAVVTQSTTNATGVLSTGNGAGLGGEFYGGASGDGLRATAGGNGNAGLVGVGLTGGTGGFFAGTSDFSGNADGIQSRGAGTGFGGIFTGGEQRDGVKALGGSGGPYSGIYAVGGPDGLGGGFEGGSGNGTGVSCQGSGTGTGVHGESSSGKGGYFVSTSNRGVSGASGSDTGVHGESSSGKGGYFSSVSGIGCEVGAGHLKLSGSNPANTTGYANALTPMNVPKAWAYINGNGALAAVIQSGFNVASVSKPGANRIRVTFATGMANANYAVVVTPAAGYVPTIPSRNVAYVDVVLLDSVFAELDPAVSVLQFSILVFAAQ